MPCHRGQLEEGTWLIEIGGLAVGSELNYSGFEDSLVVGLPHD